MCTSEESHTGTKRSSNVSRSLLVNRDSNHENSVISTNPFMLNKDLYITLLYTSDYFVDILSKKQLDQNVLFILNEIN